MTVQQFADEAVNHLRVMVTLVEQHAKYVNRTREEVEQLAAAKRFLQFGSMTKETHGRTQS